MEDMGGAYNMHGRNKKTEQNFDRKTWRETAE